MVVVSFINSLPSARPLHLNQQLACPLCLGCVWLLENVFWKIIFSGNANFRKRKMFPWCLVAFQKIFQKIFSDVWKKRRKRQNLEKLKTKPRRTWTKPRRTRRDLAKYRSRRSRSHEASIVIGVVLRDRRRDRCFARSFFLSLILPLRVCELSLRVPSSGNHLK